MLESLLIILTAIYYCFNFVAQVLSISEGFTFLPFVAFLIIYLWLIYVLFIEKKMQFSNIDIYLLIFILVYGVTFWINYRNIREIINYLTLVQLSMLFILLRSLLNNKKKLLFFLLVFTIGLFLFSSITILQVLHLVPAAQEATHSGAKASDSLERMNTLAAGVNRSAFYFVVGIFLPLGLVKEVKSRLGKAFLISTTLLSSVANLLTYSVGGWLALAAGLSILLLKTHSGFKKTSYVFLIFLLLGVSYYYNPRILEKFDEMRDDQVYLWGSKRASCNLAAIMATYESPLFGWGDRLPEEIGQRALRYIYSSDVRRAAHDTFLTIGGEAGLVALFFFLLFLKNLLYDYWRHCKRYNFNISDWLLACLAAAMVSALGLDLERDKVFWLLLSITGAVTLLKPETAKQRKVATWPKP